MSSFSLWHDWARPAKSLCLAMERAKGWSARCALVLYSVLKILPRGLHWLVLQPGLRSIEGLEWHLEKRRVKATALGKDTSQHT